jgi:hypothetical protein
MVQQVVVAVIAIVAFAVPVKLVHIAVAAQGAVVVANFAVPVEVVDTLAVQLVAVAVSLVVQHMIVALLVVAFVA